MPDIDQNRAVWTQTWNWFRQGDEWSDWWGGTEAMWYGALLPRLHALLPAGTILEIAPGYGRWTQFLKERCERLVVVDLSENCIEHCQRRFASSSHIEYHVNDGRSLDAIADGSVDLAFSFDSLVHVDSDVISGYLAQLERKLSPDGVGFVHHSNAGHHRSLSALARRAPQRALRPLVNMGVLPDVYAWRDETMTAERFREACRDSGLTCCTQEQIAWQTGRYLIDVLSTFTRPGSRFARPLAVARNPAFGREGRRMARLYAKPTSVLDREPTGVVEPGEQQG